MKFVQIIVIILCSVQTRAQQKIALQDDSLKNQVLKIKEANILKATNTQFQYFIIRSENATFGYDVYTDGQLYIHQPHMPALAGNSGFKDTTTAGQAARLVIQKMKGGEMPPLISIDDLKKLGICSEK